MKLQLARLFSPRFALFALVVAFILTRLTVNAPAYTDAYYHYNGALRLANGLGFTEPYLWTYLGAPAQLPETGVFPSHLYWMPMTSLIGAVGLTVSRLIGDVVLPFADFDSYAAAQWPFAVLFAGAACLAFALGGRWGGTVRHAWAAGLLMLFSGFFTRYWGTLDTFAPFAFFGGCALALAGLIAQRGRAGERISPLWALACGVCGGAAHLTRADGLLLPMLGMAALLFGLRAGGFRRTALLAACLLAGYLLVMGGWFARNLAAVGTPLPTGGAQALWYDDYDDLFTYPPVVAAENLLNGGLGAVLESRREAVANNLGTFVVVEGLVINAPLMLIGLWMRRRALAMVIFVLYALAVHLVMTLVFPFPGFRGGLLHSAAALMPFWSALGIIGLDAAIAGWGKRRRWNIVGAQRFFTGALVTFAVGLSIWIGARGSVPPLQTVPPLYQSLADALPAGARVLINDPAQLYFYTGLGGVVLPNAPAARLPEIAERYQITHVVLEGGDIIQAPQSIVGTLDPLPDFLTPLPFPDPTVRLYAIARPARD